MRLWLEDKLEGDERRRDTEVDVITKFRILKSLTPVESAMLFLIELISELSGVSLEVVILKLTDTVTVSAVVGKSDGSFVGRKVGPIEEKGMGKKVGNEMGERVLRNDGFGDSVGDDVGACDGFKLGFGEGE